MIDVGTLVEPVKQFVSIGRGPITFPQIGIVVSHEANQSNISYLYNLVYLIEDQFYMKLTDDEVNIVKD